MNDDTKNFVLDSHKFLKHTKIRALELKSGNGSIL